MALITPAEYRAMTKRNKYNRAPKEQRTAPDGTVYDSKREMEISSAYALLLETGVLERLDRQVRYPIRLNGKHVCNVILDFKLTYSDGRVEAVEVKGFETAVWRLKKRLLLAAYPGLELRIVK